LVAWSMTAFFWAGCRVGLRCNTCADRLKLYFDFCGPPKQRPFFFGAKAQSPRLSPAINILRLTRSQPMIAALIFWRQLVRHSPLYLQQGLSASKLPLEKFHRLLDLEKAEKYQKCQSCLDESGTP